jgi:DNA-binding MarR family transcriptional regulator
MNETASRAAPVPASHSGLSEPSAGHVPEARSDAAAIAEEISAWVIGQRADMMQRLCRQSLGLSTLHVLAMLDVVGPLSMSRLAELRGVSMPDATGIVGRMEERGLVERTHDAHDRRLVMVALTALGRRTAAELEFVPRGRLERILEEMAPGDRQRLATGFRAFAEASQRMARVDPTAPASSFDPSNTDCPAPGQGPSAAPGSRTEGASAAR